MPSSSLSVLKRELKALGLDAKTPGLKGDARRDALQRNLLVLDAPAALVLDAGAQQGALEARVGEGRCTAEAAGQAQARTCQSVISRE